MINPLKHDGVFPFTQKKTSNANTGMSVPFIAPMKKKSHHLERHPEQKRFSFFFVIKKFFLNDDS